jgi:two-component system LytT family sensor kinase
MRITGKDIVENWWLQEVLIFITLFILFTLNDWHLITTWIDLWMSISYFAILYAHAGVHRYFLLPILLEKHKPLPYLLSSAVLVLFFAGIISIARSWLFPDCFFNQTDIPHTYLFNIGTCVVSLIAIIAPFLLLRFYRQQKSQATHQLCVNMMELDALRSQLNPHFLFNTFNNLYGISLQEPARIPDLIMQISQLMRYQLENSNKKWVPLKDELSFIESCMALEEERVSQRCEIRYEYKNETPEVQCQIAPMILITFIENAFKHGCNSMEGSFVHIDIKVKNTTLTMNVTNSIPKKNCVTPNSIGIGLPNTEQRLNILYPGKHTLKKTVTAQTYHVELVLQLNS